jgi:hypothetical protein
MPVPRRFLILTPLLDDWVSLAHLIRDISRSNDPNACVFEIVVVDDGSSAAADAGAPPVLPWDGCVERVEVIRLAANLGHQRAIAVGLSAVAARSDLDGVIVMDSDGEDQPGDIARLLSEAERHPDKVIFAHRTRRSEGNIFKIGYFLYRALFRAMTGRGIAFGNFSLLPMPAVRRLVHMPELWNNLPATIIRSRLRYREVDTTRGARYAGASSMNLSTLIVHGLSAMAVYADIMFVRVLLAAGGVFAMTISAMAVVVGIRVTTNLAIPGWATTAFGNLLIIMLLSTVIIVSTTFMVLAGRASRPFVPIADTGIFVAMRTVIAERQPNATRSRG